MNDKKTYTYTVHLQFRAESDEAARATASTIEAIVRANDYWLVEGTHVTDADDWAEHVGARCGCGQPTINRVRVGIGKRVCSDCLNANIKANHPLHLYAIEDGPTPGKEG